MNNIDNIKQQKENENDYINNKEIINQFLKMKSHHDYMNLKDNELFIRKNIVLNIMILRNDIEKLLFSRVTTLMTKSDFKIENLIGASNYINSEIKLKVKNYYKNNNNLIDIHKRKEVL